MTSIHQPSEERRTDTSAQESEQNHSRAEEVDLTAASFPEGVPTAYDSGTPSDGPGFQPTDAGVEPTNLTIPTIRERERHGDVVADIFSRIYEDGTIFLAGPVEDGLATLVCAQLMYWQAKDPTKEITILLNSPGGVVTSGLAIYDTIQQISNPVSIVVSGQAASMGATILSGGTPGRRFAQPNASIMIHSVRGGTGGVAADIQAQGERLVKLNDRLTKIIAENCGQPYEKVKEDMRQDCFMDAEEALEYGIIDGILQPDGTILTVADLKRDQMN